MAITVLNTSIVTAGTTYNVPADGLTIVSADVLRVSTASSGLSNVATADNCDVRIDGTVVGQVSGVVLLSDGVTDSHALTVGLTGVVEGYGSSGALVQGVGATVLNHGEITSVAGVGVALQGAGANLVNTGLIASLASSGAEILGDFAEVTNSGTILGGGIIGLDLTGAPGASVLNAGLIVGSSVAIQGGSGAEVIHNSGQLDGIVALSGGNDLFDGTAGGAAFVLGGQGSDTLRGGAGDDGLRGDEANDRLTGRGGDDMIVGGSGRDRLLGGEGEDTLIGDAEADTMTGGSGADDFYFYSPYDIGTGSNSDHITDFRHGEDKLDLHLTPGLTFLGSGAFTSVALQVRYAKAKGEVQFDMNGDGVTDFVLVLDNHSLLTAGDLIL